MDVGEIIDTKGYGIATPIGSDLREVINIALLELSENGFLENIKRKWYYERGECSSSDTKNFNRQAMYTLPDMDFIFYGSIKKVLSLEYFRF